MIILQAYRNHSAVLIQQCACHKPGSPKITPRGEIKSDQMEVYISRNKIGFLCVLCSADAQVLFNEPCLELKVVSNLDAQRVKTHLTLSLQLLLCQISRQLEGKIQLNCSMGILIEFLFLFFFTFFPLFSFLMKILMNGVVIDVTVQPVYQVCF